jgi:hypothetical protein
MASAYAAFGICRLEQYLACCAPKIRERLGRR